MELSVDVHTAGVPTLGQFWGQWVHVHTVRAGCCWRFGTAAPCLSPPQRPCLDLLPECSPLHSVPGWHAWPMTAQGGQMVPSVTLFTLDPGVLPWDCDV